MTDSSSNESGEDAFGNDPSPPSNDLNRLRRILVGPEQEQLHTLRKRLDDPGLNAKEISRVLPEAMIIRSARDGMIAKALEPTIGEALRASVKRDRKILVDALFPVMAPAIRKAISSTILAMVQSLNQVIEHSFSLRGLKWRIEAIRARKPFAEVVLLHTLAYQVEEVFLIYRENGLMLQHVAAKEVFAQDPDLVSGMLTAIQDFVRDSFGAERGEGLDTFRVGERSVWIEHGPHAIIAAVIRGNPPEDFKSFLKETLDIIHLEQGEALESYDGDSAPFEPVKVHLENCLQSRFRQEAKKTTPLVWVLPALVVLLLLLWAFNIFQSHQRWAEFSERLNREPGIMVTMAEKKSGKYYVSGLLDPLALNPQKILEETKISKDEVVFRWEPYHSFTPEFISKRINLMLSPPQTVSLKYDDGILSAGGSAFHAWIVEARRMAATIPSIVRFTENGLIDIDSALGPPGTVTLELKGTTLFAHGSASHKWIARASEVSRGLPGITAFIAGLTDLDQKEMDGLRAKFERHAVYFEADRFELSPDQMKVLEDMGQDTKRLIQLAGVLKKDILLEITGHSDSKGNEKINIRLSQKRAEKISSFLVDLGLEDKFLVARGIGSAKPAVEETSDMGSNVNRRATFRVVSKDFSK